MLAMFCNKGCKLNWNSVGSVHLLAIFFTMDKLVFSGTYAVCYVLDGMTN